MKHKSIFHTDATRKTTNRILTRSLSAALAITLCFATFPLSRRLIDMTISAYATEEGKNQIVGIIRNASIRRGLECKDIAGKPNNPNARIELLFQCRNQTGRAAIILSDIFYVTTITIDGYFDSENIGLIEGIMSDTLSQIERLPEVKIREVLRVRH